MSRLSSAIRLKRFKPRDESKIDLTIETNTGERFKLKILDSSLSGIGTYIKFEDLQNTESLNIKNGDIIPESKLCWQNNEISLGRLAVKRVLKTEESIFIGFSCIDTRFPLLGDLSKHFQELDKGKENPLDFELGSKKFTLASFIEADHSNADLFHKCKEYMLMQADFMKNPLFQFYPVRHEVKSTTVIMSLPRNPKPKNYVNFASYDYFGLSSDPQMKEVTIKTIEEFGVSATSSPTNSGNSKHHEQLEQSIATMLRKEASLVFSSGFAANIGCITALLSSSDLAIADIACHASIHDGLSASKAKIRIFRHNDNKHLDKLLQENRGNHAGVLTLTEGLFSMDGDVPDLKGFIKKSKEFGARTFIDECHSFGIMGANGLGAAERSGVLDDFDLYIGSLSKGPGGGGGFVAGSKELITWLKYFARTELFSSALSPCLAAASLKGIELIKNDSNRRKRLLENINHFRNGLEDIGYKPKSDRESPIIPVIIRDQELMGKMNQVLIDHGVFVNPILFPAVALDQCRFRFTLTANHTNSDIELALVALKNAFEKFDWNQENSDER